MEEARESREDAMEGERRGRVRGMNVARWGMREAERVTEGRLYIVASVP